MKTIKLTTFNDLGVCDRQDVNDLIAALVRIGYEVWITDDWNCTIEDTISLSQNPLIQDSITIIQNVSC